MWGQGLSGQCGESSVTPPLQVPSCSFFSASLSLLATTGLCPAHSVQAHLHGLPEGQRTEGWLSLTLLESHPQADSAFALQIDVCTLPWHGSPSSQSEIALMIHWPNPLHFPLQVSPELSSLFNIHGLSFGFFFGQL